MRLIAVGINHRTAPVALRESLDFRRAGLEAGLEALGRRELVREAVLVSTCNRVEIYAGVDSDTVADACARFLARVSRRRVGDARPPSLRPRAATTPRGISFASPPGSIRWSSASRRFSDR